MNEERLQELLAVYRHRGPMPDFRSGGAGPSAGTGPLESRPPHTMWWLAAAAAVLIVLFVLVRPRDQHLWLVTSSLIPRALRTGDVVSTAPGSHVRLESREIGIVDVSGKTTLRLTGRNRLELAEGTIHAKTVSPPGLFIVDTPRARATDLGCEYVLSVSASGGGTLRVLAGWVALTREWTQSLVPQGAVAAIASDGRLSAPIFEDAPRPFQEAVRRYSFGSHEDLQTILALARKRDAVTLVNLFRFAASDDRLRIYDRLNQLVPAPATVPRDAIQYWSIGMTDPWWPDILKASGVRAIKKKKRMPRGL